MQKNIYLNRLVSDIWRRRRSKINVKLSASCVSNSVRSQVYQQEHNLYVFLKYGSFGNTLVSRSDGFHSSNFISNFLGDNLVVF